MIEQINWTRGDELQLLSINDGYAPLTLALAEVERMCRVAGSVPADALINEIKKEVA